MIHRHPYAKSIWNPIFLSLNVPVLEIKLANRGKTFGLLGIQIRLVKKVSQYIVITHQYGPPTKKCIHIFNALPTQGHVSDNNAHAHSHSMTQAHYLSFLHQDSTKSSLESICTYHKLFVWTYNI